MLNAEMAGRIQLRLQIIDINMIKNLKTSVKLLAPYLAVCIFWCIFKNGWLAIIAYHIQILLWTRHIPNMSLPKQKKLILVAIPAILAGPLLYFLLPYITQTELSIWLQEYHISGLSLALMIPYFGLIHPVLEQIHWESLREKTYLSHFAFAGYHILVLYSLLTIPWVIFCFIVLSFTSFMWHKVAQQSKTLAIPIASHVLADLGIIVVAWLQT